MGIAALVDIVLPIFGFIVIGYLSVLTGLVSDATGDALGDFVFTIAVPVLMFRALGTFALPEISPWPYWLTYFAGAAGVWIAGSLIVRRMFGRDARAGVIAGVSASYGNIVLLGIPVFDQAFGEEGLVVGFVLISVHLPVMMVATMVLIDRAERLDTNGPAGAGPLGVARRVAVGLARNPIIVAVVAGALFRATGLPLAGIPGRIVDRLADVTVPLALLALGMGLKRHGVSGNVRPAIVLGLLKLVAMPAVIYLLASRIAGLPPLVTGVATLAAAMPTGVTAFLIATRFRTGLALSSNTITLSTAASVLTLTGWLAVLGG